VFVEQAGDGCAGGNRREVFLLSREDVDLGAGAGEGPGARSVFTLRLLTPAPPAPGARTAMHGARAPRVDPAAEERLRRARALRLGAAAAARPGAEAPDPADEAAAANIPHFLAASRRADHAAAMACAFSRALAQQDSLDVVVAREVEARVAPGVAREAAAARSGARVAMRREARRRGLPLSSAGGAPAAPAAPASMEAKCAPPTPPATSCTLCGAHVFCKVDLCREGHRMEGAVARGAAAPPTSPLALRGGEKARLPLPTMNWGLARSPEREEGRELEVADFYHKLSAQDWGLGLTGTLAEARSITQNLLRAADLLKK
jgi:hypothetical protein